MKMSSEFKKVKKRDIECYWRGSRLNKSLLKFWGKILLTSCGSYNKGIDNLV